MISLCINIFILLLGACVVWVGFKFVDYYVGFPHWVETTLIAFLIILITTSIGYKVYSLKSSKNFSEKQAVREFKSNQNSEYSQLWLDYLAFRDAEIGRLGSEDKFKKFLENRKLSEREYAVEVITSMLQEQGVEDVSIAEDCVNENIVGSLE